MWDRPRLKAAFRPENRIPINQFVVNAIAVWTSWGIIQVNAEAAAILGRRNCRIRQES